MAAKPFAVRIFLADGTIDGVKIVAKSKWTGRAIVLPRARLSAEAEREELNAPGVYLLIGDSGVGAAPTLAIAAADPVCAQLQQREQQRYFWSRAFVFTAKKEPLSPELIHYLAIRLRQQAAAGHCNLVAADVAADDTGATPPPRLTPAATAEAESFLEHILSICPVLGLRAFEHKQ